MKKPPCGRGGENFGEYTRHRGEKIAKFKRSGHGLVVGAAGRTGGPVIHKLRKTRHFRYDAGMILIWGVLFWAVGLSAVGGVQGESGPVADRRMAVTIDDLPVAPPGAHSIQEQERITGRLIEVLTRHRVPAIGFVNENKLEVSGRVDPARVALLERWLEAGFELGNHGYAHLDLHRVDPEVWMRDVSRGERVLRPLMADRGLAPRFFRHPFLHTGRSLEVKRQTADFLADHGYRVAPVTIDNQEWIFGGAYARATDDSERRRLGEAYIDYMEAMVEYYEAQSRAIVGEEIPQTLLIHAYALNADWLERLLQRLAGRGYRFVSLEEALKHPAYQSADTFTGAGGITWLHRWGISKGMAGTAFSGEPGIPDWLK